MEQLDVMKLMNAMNQFLFRFSLAVSLAVSSLAMVPDAAAQVEDKPKKLLVVTVTKGFRHSSIPTAESVIEKLAKNNDKLVVDFVRTDEEMKRKMTPEALKSYDGFIFANTSGTLPLPDKEAFLEAIRGGKAFIGMHAASDTFRSKDGVDPYIEMLGGEFQWHGDQVGVECRIHDSQHPSTTHFEGPWSIEREEIYIFQNYDRRRVHDLLALDRHPNKPEERGHFPVSWCRQYGQGKVFYTSLGHREDIWENELYQQHIEGGILWALGLKPGRDLDHAP
jgi:uncharacterized protein